MLVTTATSAMLKIAGKPHTWMKSTTFPVPNLGSAEQPIGEVAERAAEHQPEGGRPGEGTDAERNRR